MFSFFKRKSKYPNFPLLWTFEKRNHYFVRNAEWGWLDEKQVVVTDPVTLQATPLPDWQQYIFLSAGGHVPVFELVKHAADQYEENIPSNLDHVIIHELLALHDKKIILFSGKPTALRDEFLQPVLLK